MIKYLVSLLFVVSSTYAKNITLGVFQLNVKIGERVFIDTLEVKKINSNKIEGIFTIPKVFSVPFYGEFKDGHLKGHFLAKEGGRQYQVNLKARVTDGCLIQGELLTKGQKFAYFSGRKEQCHE